MAVFSVCGENDTLWQWDLDRRLTVEHPACHQVHFCGGGEEALVCGVYEEDGKRFADIPNVLLQTDEPLKVYAFVTDRDGKRTVISERFMVEARPKPQGYIYTETEAWTVEKAVFDALQEAKENGDFRGEPGPKGDPGVVKFVVVTALPEEDAENAIYLLPNEEGAAENLFDEYIFVDGKWEKIGSAAVAVDLDEYVKKTDYASSTNPGVVRVAYTQQGLYTHSDGWIAVWGANKDLINAKNSRHNPITTDMVDYAVKVGVTTNTEPLTQEEKKAACGWLGTGVITGNADSTLTILLADGSKYKVNATREDT